MIAFVKDIKYFDQVLGLGLGCAKTKKCKTKDIKKGGNNSTWIFLDVYHASPMSYDAQIMS